MSFSWTGRQLDSVTKDGVTTTYTYDSNGLRTSKTTGDDVTEYTYLGSSLVYQVTNKGQSDEVSLYFYYDDTGLAAFYYESAQYPSDNGIYHYVKDAQGNIWGIVDNKGTQIVKYEFSAYGEYRSRWSPEEVSLEEIRRNNRVKSANPFDYRGYYYDEETGLYYCQSRYYDPVVDRFLNADTTDILVAKNDLYDKNLFAYCDNNPVVRYDTGGHFWDTLFDVVSLVISVVDVVNNPTDTMAWVGLAADVVSLILPGVTGGSAVVKAVSKADDVVDTIKTANKVDNVADTVNTANKVDFYVTPKGDAIPATRSGFDENLSKLDNKKNKYYGIDSRGPVRIRVEQHPPTPNFNGPLNPFHDKLHFHIDRKINEVTGGYKKTYTGLMEWLK